MADEPLNLSDVIESLEKLNSRLKEGRHESFSIAESVKSLTGGYHRLVDSASSFAGFLSRSAAVAAEQRRAIVGAAIAASVEEEAVLKRMILAKEISFAAMQRRVAEIRRTRPIQLLDDGLAEKVNAAAAAVQGLRESFPIKLLNSAVTLSFQYGTSLIEANSALRVRTRLLEDAYAAQAATGASQELMNNLQKAFIGRGLEMRQNYRELLTTSVRLVDGLGISVDSAARLATVANSARTPFTQLADTISRIVDRTAVAADEAARYAEALTRATLGGAGIGADIDLSRLGETTEVIANLEGMLKSVVSEPDAISKLLTRFASLGDLGGLGMALGTGGTRFLEDPERVRQVIANLNEYIETVGSSQPGLETLSTQLGVSRETLQGFNRALSANNGIIAERSAAEAAQNTLRERYTKQISEQGQVFTKLGFQLQALMSTALSPAVEVVRGLSYVLGKALSLLDRFREGLGGVLTTMFSAAVLGTAVIRIAQLTASIITLGRAAVSARLAALSAAGAAGKAQIGTAGAAGKAQIGTAVATGVAGALSRLGGQLTAWVGRLMTGGFIMRMLGSVLRVTLVPLLTRLAPLLLGFLPGLIIGALVLLWPLLKKLFKKLFTGRDRKEIEFRTPTEIGKDLAAGVVNSIQQGQIGQAFFAPINRFFDEARQRRLSEQDIAAVTNRALDAAETAVRVQSMKVQIAVDETVRARELQKQEEMIKTVKELSGLVLEIRRDYANNLADIRRKEAADKHRRSTERAEQQARQAASIGGAVINALYDPHHGGLFVQ